MSALTAVLAGVTCFLPVLLVSAKTFVSMLYVYTETCEFYICLITASHTTAEDVGVLIPATSCPGQVLWLCFGPLSLSLIQST